MEYEIDAELHNQSVPFPPANFHIWPETRVGALFFDGLVALVLIALWIIPRRVYSTKNIDTSDYICINRFKLWGFWVCGLDYVKVDGDNIVITKLRGFRCCSVRHRKFPLSSVTKIYLAKRKWLCSLCPLWALLAGCLCGMWLHFIPCIWWTCDWGYYDGQNVRGGIWFAGWAIFFVIFILLYRTVEVVITVREDPNIETTKTYHLSVGEGVTYNIDDPVAKYDLNELKKGIYQAPRHDKLYYYY